MKLFATILGSLVIVALIIRGLREAWRETRTLQYAKKRESIPSEPTPSPSADS